MMINESFMNILMDDSLSNEDKIEALKMYCNDYKTDEDIRSSSFDMDREYLYRKCMNEYKDIWMLLSPQSQKDLKLAYFYEKFIDRIEDDQTTPVNKLTKTVENEIRNNLFIKYAKSFKDHRLEINNKTDAIFDGFLNSYLTSGNPHIELGQMLKTIRYSSFDSTSSNYAHGLKEYIFSDNGWNENMFYSKGDEKYYTYYSFKFRNKSSHGYIYDSNVTKECMKVTKDILHWFLGSMKE